MQTELMAAHYDAHLASEALRSSREHLSDLSFHMEDGQARVSELEAQAAHLEEQAGVANVARAEAEARAADLAQQVRACAAVTRPCARDMASILEPCPMRLALPDPWAVRLELPMVDLDIQVVPPVLVQTRRVCIFRLHLQMRLVSQGVLLLMCRWQRSGSEAGSLPRSWQLPGTPPVPRPCAHRWRAQKMQSARPISMPSICARHEFSADPSVLPVCSRVWS